MSIESTPLPECTAAFERALSSVHGDATQRDRVLADGVRVMREALAKSGGDPRIWTYLGELELQRARFLEALEAFRRAIELDPTDALAQSGYAQGLIELGRDDEAEAALCAALVRQDSGLLRGQLGGLLIRQGRYDEAVRELDLGLAVEPDNEELLLLYARHLAESDDERRALLERAIAADPDFVEALCDLGALFADQGLVDAAQRCFERALVIDDECLEALLGLSAAVRATDARRATELAGRAIELDPEDPRGWTAMGEALWDRGARAKAHRALERASSVRPVNQDGARAHWLRARLSEQDGLVQHAIWRLEEGAAHAHLWPPIAADLGRLYADAGRRADALRWLAVALEHDVEDEDSRRLVRRLEEE